MVIAAHPDDEVLGCGATIARMAQDGCEIYTVILGEGVTSRDEERDVGERNAEICDLKLCVKRANDVLGVKESITYQLPDNRFDTVPMLDIVKIIEKLIKEIEPQIIFTHHERDLNIDHRLTFVAVMTATRPLPGVCVKELYSFEVSSSTEWSYPLSFRPDVYFDVSGTLSDKIQAASEYGSEMREFPHPRSIQGIEVNASYWGMRNGFKYAEAFKCIRCLK